MASTPLSQPLTRVAELQRIHDLILEAQEKFVDRITTIATKRSTLAAQELQLLVTNRPLPEDLVTTSQSLDAEETDLLDRMAAFMKRQEERISSLLGR